MADLLPRSAPNCPPPLPSAGNRLDRDSGSYPDGKAFGPRFHFLNGIIILLLPFLLSPYRLG